VFNIRISLIINDIFSLSSSTSAVCAEAVTDLRIGQIGHGLGPRILESPAQLFPTTT